MLKQRRTRIVLVTLALATLVTSGVAVAHAGSSDFLTGTWVGTSYDVTYNLPGELTAVFQPRTGGTFDGAIFARYPDGTAQVCTVTNGIVLPSGDLHMPVVCRVVGTHLTDAAVIDMQADATKTTLTGSWHGVTHEVGYFTLTRQ